eukprot:6205185-Pleurochrysis_carterae.AAC.8
MGSPISTRSPPTRGTSQATGDTSLRFPDAVGATNEKCGEAKYLAWGVGKKCADDCFIYRGQRECTSAGDTAEM